MWREYCIEVKILILELDCLGRVRLYFCCDKVVVIRRRVSFNKFKVIFIFFFVYWLFKGAICRREIFLVEEVMVGYMVLKNNKWVGYGLVLVKDYFGVICRVFSEGR